MTSQNTLVRQVIVKGIDAPELPLLASALQTGFTAVARDGWSVIVTDTDVPTESVIALGGENVFSATITSDGAERTLTLFPPRSVLASHAHDQASDQTPGTLATTLTWGAPVEESLARLLTGEESPGQRELTQERQHAIELAVESIASLADLDPAATSRLRNYALTPSSTLVLESVLQLLNLPVVAAKIVEGQQELADVSDARHYEPQPPITSFLDAVTTEPTGSDPLSRAYRWALRRPTVFLAVGGAEVVAGSALATLAARQGRGSRLLGTASALLFTDAASQVALWASVKGRRKR